MKRSTTLLILFLVFAFYFKADINLKLKNDTIYSKKEYKLLFTKSN